MVDVNVEFVLGQDEPVAADFKIKPDVEFLADIKVEQSTDYEKDVEAAIKAAHEAVEVNAYVQEVADELLNNEDIKVVSENIEEITDVAQHIDTIRFGAYNEEFTEADWEEESGKYKITLSYNMVLGVYKLDSNVYKAVTNIDIVKDSNGVTIYSQDAFDGYAVLVNYATPTTYIFEQAEASDTWEISHGLGRYPSVMIVDSSGNAFRAKVQYINENQLVVTMNGATTGKAYLN